MSMRDFMLKLHCEQDLNYLLNKEVRAIDEIVGPLEPGGKGGDCPKSRILAEQLPYARHYYPLSIWNRSQL